MSVYLSMSAQLSSQSFSVHLLTSHLTQHFCPSLISISYVQEAEGSGPGSIPGNQPHPHTFAECVVIVLQSSSQVVSICVLE